MTTSVTARQRRIDLAELASLPSFYLPTVAWAGDRVAFYWDRTGRLELYVMDLRTRAIQQVSHGEVPRAVRTGFAWDRADRAIVFGKDELGNEQHDLYRIELASGAVTRLSHDPTAEEHAIEFSPDDAWLTTNATKRHPDAPDQPGQMNVWRMRADGSDYQPLTRYRFPARGGRWSPDGQWLSFETNEDPDHLRNRDGYLMRPDGSEVRKVFSLQPGSQDLLADWHPDSRHLAVQSDASGLGRVGVMAIDTGQVRWLTPEGLDEASVRFSRSGQQLVCLRNHEAQVRPIVYDLASGQARELSVPPGVATAAEFVLDDRGVLIAYSTSTVRPSLVLYDLERDTLETLIEPIYGSIDPSVFVEAQHVWYPSFDGRQIPGLLYVPHDAVDGERLPALVHVHGGPTNQWVRGFDPFVQYLVSRGFVVLAPNIRGSTGYGVEFRDAALRDWGGADLEDVAAGAEYLKQLRFVDPGRLGVFGGSYGGYMTFMAVTRKPDLWKAAAASVGISDLHRMYAQSKEHFRYFLRTQMGDPERDAELWRDRSAIHFAEHLRAKLLIVHGTHDPRCPVEQSRLFRDRLRELGKREGEDFLYVEYDDIGHGSVDIEHKLRNFRLMADFFERVL